MNDENILTTLSNYLKIPIAERTLSPVEIGKLIKIATESMSSSQIAELLGIKDKNFIKRFIEILNLPTDIQDKISWQNTLGTVSFTSAYQISTEKNAEKKSNAINFIRQNSSFSRKDISELIN
tara:strand:- start:74 stop:442 length:369 start_codon:yes stop_codon:yes gene_type:complete